MVIATTAALVQLTAGALLGAVVSVALHAAHSRWMRRRVDRRSTFSGTWYQELLARGPLPRRIDVVTLSQDGALLFGEFHRQAPADDAGRKWAIHGYIYGNRAVFYFYTITPQQDPSSFGVITLARDTENKRGQAWYGVYFRPDNEEFSDIVNGLMDPRPVAWQRFPKHQVDFVSRASRSTRAASELGDDWDTGDEHH